jgi:hypothetical protein
LNAATALGPSAHTEAVNAFTDAMSAGYQVIAVVVAIAAVTVALGLRPRPQPVG